MIRNVINPETLRLLTASLWRQKILRKPYLERDDVIMSRLIEYLGVILLIVFVVVLLLPATSQRDASPRTQCRNNLKQIGLALHIYHDIYKAFPPAYAVDGTGNRLHSWRTLILPYLDRQKLYETIALSKPWNDPFNAVAYQTAIPAFKCPYDLTATPSTTHLTIVTPDSVLRPVQSCKIADITDGLSHTLMIVEVIQQKAVHWMAPVDLDELMLRSKDATKKKSHSGDRHALFVDGSARFLSDKMPYEQLHALSTVNCGEIVGDF